MAEPVSGISVVVDEDDNSVRVNDVAGSVETDQDDGGVVVQLDARRAKKEDDESDFYRNLADDLDPQRLAGLANDLHEAISADDRSRSNWLAIRARAMDFLGLELKEPRANAADSSAAVEGLSTVTNPAMLQICLKAWANAQAELLPAEGPCKIDEINELATPQEDELAETFERDMNYFLTVTASEYYPDTSHMLLWGNIFGGSGFKKIYWCPMKRRPTSQSVSPTDLIVSDTTKDLRSCARITHQIEMRPSLMARMKFLGAYRKVDPLPEPQDSPNAVQAKIAAIQGTQPVPERQEDKPYILWECQCELDLDEYAPKKFKGSNVPLPYIVTLDKESKEILALRRDWKEDDEEAERRRLYVKYPYVPGPGFYGTGLAHIVGNLAQALTAAQRLSLDAAMFANFPSFLISKLGGRQNTSDFRLSPGTGQPIETGDKPINQTVMPLPYHDVTGGMLQLMEMMQKQADTVGGVAEIPTAEGVQNVTATAMLAAVEQATKVMAAAHKGMHQAQAEELQLLIELFREHPEDFWKANKFGKDYWNEQKLLQALEDYDLVPRSDPNTPSHIHRLARAYAAVQLSAMPQFMPLIDAREVLERALRAAGEDPAGLMMPPAPAAPAPPNPQLITAMANMQKAQTAQFKAGVDAQESQTDAVTKEKELQVKQAMDTVDLSKEMIIHGADNAKLAVEQRRMAQDQNLAERQHAHEANLAERQHGLAVQQAHHDANMDIAEHALNTYEVMHPPKPTDSGAKKK